MAKSRPSAPPPPPTSRPSKGKINWWNFVIFLLIAVLLAKCVTLGRAVRILQQENAEIDHRSIGGAALEPRQKGN
ncbi:MAG: hypothetical protein HQL48_06760 [Gammaproteobacteria bacterium]|nr:hypothetical protein [Gammaproteobacteria bacterium]